MGIKICLCPIWEFFCKSIQSLAAADWKESEPSEEFDFGTVDKVGLAERVFYTGDEEC